MPHFKAFGMMNLQYEIRICQKIHDKGTMSQWQIQVTIFLSGTDVKSPHGVICKNLHPNNSTQKLRSLYLTHCQQSLEAF